MHFVYDRPWFLQLQLQQAHNSKVEVRFCVSPLCADRLWNAQGLLLRSRFCSSNTGQECGWHHDVAVSPGPPGARGGGLEQLIRAEEHLCLPGTLRGSLLHHWWHHTRALLAWLPLDCDLQLQKQTTHAHPAASPASQHNMPIRRNDGQQSMRHLHRQQQTLHLLCYPMSRVRSTIQPCKSSAGGTPRNPTT